MPKELLIDAAHAEETRVAIVEDKQLLDFDIENNSKKTLKGNIYLGKIVRVEPSLQAAFVDYGGNRHGFLAFTEIHPDYFRIPVSDREKLNQPIDENVKKLSDSLVDNSEENENEDSSEVDAIEIPEVDVDPEEDIEDNSNSNLDKELGEETNPYKLYKIQEVIKSRQIVLIQVVKEERGNKGAALTTFISLAGRYCVLMPNAQHSGGISRRITDSSDRKRLKSIINDLGLSEGNSLIVRTAGLDRSKTEIKRDYGYLTKLWEEICAETVKSNAPSLIYEEADLIRRTIRDVYSKEIDTIYVEGNEGYKSAKKYIKDMVPSHAKKVQPYKDDNCPLFFKYQIEQQIEQMYSPTVKLKSGGYIVINQTEALVAIDVNSGRATRERHIETTAFNTNLEAAEEVARQIRLRDYAGLIVIDFIDMNDPKNNQAVEKKLRDSLAMDRARVQAGRISQFGLLEMSRQRLRPSIMESSTVKCINCGGSGVVRSVESIGLQMLRVIEEICLSKKCGRQINIYMPSNVAFYLLSNKRHELSALETRFQLKLQLKEDNRLINTGFKIESESGNFIADGHGNSASNDQKNNNDATNKNKVSAQTSNAKNKKIKNSQKNPKPNPSNNETDMGDNKKAMRSDVGKKNKKRNYHHNKKNQKRHDNKNIPLESSNKKETKIEDSQSNERPHKKESNNPINNDTQNSKRKGWWQKLLD
jgi:ribonuclease E